MNYIKNIEITDVVLKNTEFFKLGLETNLDDCLRLFEDVSFITPSI